MANYGLPSTIQRSIRMTEYVGPKIPKISYAFGGGYISKYAYILLPYVRSISLIEFLINLNQTGRNISLEDNLYLFKQILLAVHEFQVKTGQSHCDLKPDNFLLTETGEIKMIDFCHALPSDQLTQKRTGTSQYLAPDVRIAT